MPYVFGFMTATLLALSVAFYASFNGYMSRSIPFAFHGIVIKGHPANTEEQGYNQNDIDAINQLSNQ